MHLFRALHGFHGSVINTHVPSGRFQKNRRCTVPAFPTPTMFLPAWCRMRRPPAMVLNAGRKSYDVHSCSSVSRPPEQVATCAGQPSAPVHPQTASATQRRVGDAAVTAASAGRPFANRVCNGNAMDVRVSSVCEVHFTGGLHPSALASQCERLPAKRRFLRCTNVHSPRSGGCQPAVARNRDGGRNATSVGERTLCTRAASVSRRGALPIRDIGSCYPETNELLGEPTPGECSDDSVDRAGRSILSAVRRGWHRRTCRTSKTGAEKVPTANTQENL